MTVYNEDVLGLVKHHVLEVAAGDHLVHPGHKGEKVEGGGCRVRGEDELSENYELNDHRTYGHFRM